MLELKYAMGLLTHFDYIRPDLVMLILHEVECCTNNNTRDEMTESELSVRDAAYHTVRSYPGGAVALAARCGMKSGATLSHKVAPNSTNYYLSLEEAITIQAFTQDYRILYAMARELGHACINVTESEVEDVNQNIAATVKEFGSYLQSVSESVADQQVTDNEISEIAAHMGCLIAEANRLHATLMRLNKKAKKPAFLHLKQVSAVPSTTKASVRK